MPFGKLIISSFNLNRNNIRITSISALMLVLFMFLRLPFNEYWTTSKHIQNISPFLYWLGNMVIDAILYLILCGFVVALFVIFMDGMFTATEWRE
jgi:ABC-type multidrug transport system permease subunit